MLRLFRMISVAEGLSYLTILCVSLGMISRDFVFSIGLTHGVLFVGYIMLSLMVSDKLKWSVLKWLALFVAAIIPFAFIAVEIVLRKQLICESAVESP